MRLKTAFLLVLAALALVAAGCGGEETAPLPEEVEGTVPADTAATEPETETGTQDDGAEDDGAGGEGDAEAGREVYASAGCGGCHTFEEAGSTGTVGPSFDDTETPYDEAVEVITNGRGAMPAFGNQLDEQQIRDVAAFVSDS
ncbi:MAG TPA: cytochrome c [Gaiellaceae bacterium]|nr:cytochrome c [Gaiellaceae bacterium]